MRIAVAIVLALPAAAVVPASAPAARECRGLQVCIPIAGPWVAVPAAPRGQPFARVEYQLPCRKGSVVGGTDALVGDPELEVTFLGFLGSPVGPGITTRTSAIFAGVYGGARRRPATFRPFLGCIPTSGAGGRGTTGVAALRPGEPLLRRFRNVSVRPGNPQAFSLGCGRGERLVGSGHAVSFRQEAAPPVEWIADVRTSTRVRGGRVVVEAFRDVAVPLDTRVELQVQALCARGQ